MITTSRPTQFTQVSAGGVQRQPSQTEDLPQGLDQIGNFDRQLQFGSTGEDVKRLQQFLNQSGYIVSKEGAGSIGNETEYFGPATQKALQEYQKSQGIVSTGDPQSTGYGRLGPQTLQSVNTFISTSTGQPDTDVATDDKLASVGDNGASTGTLPDTPDPITEEELERLLVNENLSDDQREMLRKMFAVVSTNDTDQVNKMVEAFKFSTEFSDPYFKAQISLVTDALSRSISSMEGDLEFEERQLQQTLEDLRANLEASGAELGFNEARELKALERNYTQDLENTVQNLASVGKTSSSVRSKTLGLLREEKEGLVESTGRKYAYQRGVDERQLSTKERDTAQEVARLKELTEQGVISNIRKAEEQVGSQTLGNLGYQNLLGGVGGQLPREKRKEALDFSSSFVF